LLKFRNKAPGISGNELKPGIYVYNNAARYRNHLCFCPGGFDGGCAQEEKNHLSMNPVHGHQFVLVLIMFMAGVTSMFH
jgi:hypothetical protein